MRFSIGGSSNTDSGKVDGTLETKYKFSEYGTTFTEKWNTSNQLSTTVDVQDKILKGLKVTFDSTFSPQVSSRSQLEVGYCMLNVLYHLMNI